MERKSIQQVLFDHDLGLSERLGQHFLVDDQTIDLIASSVVQGGKVIEVGSGIGHVTGAIAEKAGKVVGIEIDTRFEPILEGIQSRNPKIKFVFGDALQVPLDSLIDRNEKVQIVANLPFHITEPFMHKLIDLPVVNAILVLGDNAARELQEPETSLGFGKLSLLAQTFFDFRVLSQVPREAFYPQPRTDAVIVELEPKDRREIEANPASYVFTYLFRNAGKYGLVVNDMKQALVEASQRTGSDLSKEEFHRKNRSRVKKELKRMLDEYNGSGNIAALENHNRNGNGSTIVSQSQALGVIGRMGIPDSVLSKPFFRLDNQDIRDLATAVRGFYSR